MFLGLVVYCFWSFGPWAANGFSADAGIPLMMSNSTSFGVYDLFFYGQDRLGAWPYLSMATVKLITGYEWQAHSVFLVLVLFVLSSFYPLTRLFPKSPLVVALCFFLVLHNPPVYKSLFAICGFYGWQIAALLWSHYHMRQWMQEGAIRHGMGALTFSTLACWNSIVCFGYLTIILVTELVAAELGFWDCVWRSRWKRWLKSFAPLLGGLALSLLIVYVHSFSEYPIGRTELEIRFEQLFTRWPDMWRGYLADSAWWPTLLVSLTGAIAILFLALKSLTGADRSQLLIDNHACARTVLAWSLVATSNYLIVIPSKMWVLSDYSQRYLGVAQFFWPLSACLAVVLFVAAISDPAWQKRVSVCLVLVGIVVGGMLASQVRRENKDFTKWRDIAAMLEHRYPKALLMSHYWPVYAVIGMQGSQRMTPIEQGEHPYRTPWTAAALEAGREVVFIRIANNFNVTAPASPTMRQRGCDLRLQTPFVDRGSDYSIDVYEVLSCD